MSSAMRRNSYWLIACASFFLLLAPSITGCHRETPHSEVPTTSMPKRDINAVLRDHDKELMAIPGVVGVYVGLLEDDKTPCLKVMAIKKTPELERRIPKVLEGYRVLIEETGVIRPMPKK